MGLDTHNVDVSVCRECHALCFHHFILDLSFVPSHSCSFLCAPKLLFLPNGELLFQTIFPDGPIIAGVDAPNRLTD